MYLRTDLAQESNRKIAVGKLKITTMLKNKTWTIQQGKNHKRTMNGLK